MAASLDPDDDLLDEEVDPELIDEDGEGEEEPSFSDPIGPKRTNLDDMREQLLNRRVNEKDAKDKTNTPSERFKEEAKDRLKDSASDEIKKRGKKAIGNAAKKVGEKAAQRLGKAGLQTAGQAALGGGAAAGGAGAAGAAGVAGAGAAGTAAGAAGTAGAAAAGTGAATVGGATAVATSEVWVPAVLIGCGILRHRPAWHHIFPLPCCSWSSARRYRRTPTRPVAHVREQPGYKPSDPGR